MAKHTARALAVGVLVLGVVVSCTVLEQRHGWRESHGPLVPHQSFPADCSICHETGGWDVLKPDFVFDHAAETGVPLEGAHAEAQCLRCHNDRGPVAVFAARSCAGCHVDPHQGELGATCDGCHVESDWRPVGIITEHARTRFPLTGAHVALACFTCHPGAESGSFLGQDPSCESCHLDDVGRSTALDHFANGLTSDCESCHIPTAWENARFPHPGTLTLVGAHDRDCGDCHSGGVFTGLDPACVNCHLTEYTGASDPPHASFPTTCQDCHSVFAWEPAIFQHPSSFPLTGAHVPLDCNDCHTGGTLSGLDPDCVSCHLDEYDATTSPSHSASGFPTTCQSCHSTISWFGATFAHAFPINSGRHSSADCTDCHPDLSNPMTFTCTTGGCHDQGETDDDHDEVDNYVYSSPACYDCHPNGDH